MEVRRHTTREMCHAKDSARNGIRYRHLPVEK